MYFTHTNYKKESFIATAALFTLLLLLLLFMTYSKSDISTDLEGGGGGGDIAVNFGDSEVGQGTNFENKETVQAASKARQPEKQEAEALVTNESDNEDAVAVADTKKPKEQPKKPVEKPAEKPKPSASVSNALANMQNKGNSKEGDGNDGLSGNKGKAYGDPNATGYNGGGGSGTGSGGGNGSGEGLGTGSGYGNGNGGGRGNGTGNYQLSGRKVLSKPAPRYTCNEEGMVVVEISVNNSGSVISATPGVRGTTNAAKCLLDQAKIAAMNTKFDASASAPDRQVGRIIYNFKLTE